MKSSIKLSLIVARDRKGAIGKGGSLPWKLADDLAFFKSVTSDHPVIMGRKTWDSLPKKPLPNRENIVLTRDWTFRGHGARVYTALAPAIEAGKALAREAGTREVFIIGGAALYAAAIDFIDIMYITEVDADVGGDTFFPVVDESNFESLVAERVEADERNQYSFQVRILKRKT